MTITPTTTTPATALAASGLTKRYGPVTAVDQVSFQLRAGRIHLLVGPNGAGKSTLLRLLVGLSTPSAGSAWIGGRPFAALPAPARQVGAALEPLRFPPARSGRDHLRVVARAAQLPPGRADRVLELVGLDPAAARRRAGGYSLGMRQRLALAAALLGDPPVLLLDEPTTGLDLYGVGWLRSQLRQWADQGRTVLVASHSLTELAPVVDEVLVLADGRLLAHRPAATLAATATTGPTPASTPTPTLLTDLHAALLRLLATPPNPPSTKKPS